VRERLVVRAGAVEKLADLGRAAGADEEILQGEVERIARWLGLSVPPVPAPRKRKPPAKIEASPSTYPTWEEVQAAKARDERRFLQMLERASA
jgi:hypothetical protein